jgi:hypothetical protein
MPLVKERVDNLNTIGNLLISSDEERFCDMFKNYNQLFGEDGIITLLTSSDAYRDVRQLNGDMVWFDKRAQLLFAMVYDRVYHYGNQEWANYKDINEMTLFADYGIPAYLDSIDVFEYSDNLKDSISNGQIIEENSREEVEIRAATVKVGEMILENSDEDMNIPYLDYVLWSLRNDADTEQHITPTTAY